MVSSPRGSAAFSPRWGFRFIPWSRHLTSPSMYTGICKSWWPTDRAAKCEINIRHGRHRLKELGTVRRKVFLPATESELSETDYVYPANISQAGELNSVKPALNSGGSRIARLNR